MYPRRAGHIKHSETSFGERFPLGTVAVYKVLAQHTCIAFVRIYSVTCMYVHMRVLVKLSGKLAGEKRKTFHPTVALRRRRN